MTRTEQELDAIFAKACEHGEPRWEMCMEHMTVEEFCRRRDEVAS